MIEINGKVFSEGEIKQLIELVSDLISTNEDQNAKLIAMNAKLQNEEKKVSELKKQIYLLSLAFTNNTINHDETED